MAEETQTKLLNSCPSCGEVVDVTHAPPHSRFKCIHCGEVIRVRAQFNHFDIQREIGRGGMSRVFAAEDTTLKRRVALKILLEHFSQDDSRVKEFEREARITASISHPNIVKVYSVGRDQEYFYIAMELVEGGSLEDRVSLGSIAERQVLGWAKEIVGGLRAAYQKGLIHRDIKPGNILLSADGSPKIVDFGLAVFLDRQGSSDEIWATPFYVAPEKLHGVPEDFRSDIYSLGATMYQLLAGQVPFDTDTTSIQELKVLKEHIVSLEMTAPHVSVETCNLVDRMLLHNPTDRHASYEELIQHIDLAQRGLGITELTGKLTQSLTVRARNRRRWQQWVAVAGLSTGALAMALWFIFLRSPVVGASPDVSALMSLNEGIISDRTTTEAFNEARRAMLERRYMSAFELFSTIGNSPATPEPTASWTVFYSGLCALLEGDLELARERFRSLTREAQGNNLVSVDRRLARFFLRTGNLLSADQATTIDSASGLDEGSREGLAFLAFGLNNYHLEKFDSAEHFLAAFQNVRADPRYPWLEELQSLCDPLAAAVRRMSALPEITGDDELVQHRVRLSAVVELLENQQSLTSVELRFLRAERSRLDHLVAKLMAEKAGEFSAAGTNSGEDTGEMERKLISRVDRELRLLADDLAFAEAAVILDDIEVTTHVGRELLGDHTRLWRLAGDFVQRLRSDLIGGYEGTITRKERAPLKGKATASPDGDWIEIASDDGEYRADLTEIAPACLFDIGKSFLDSVRDSNEYYARSEELVAFAAQTGLSRLARRHGDELSRELPAFRTWWERVRDAAAAE